MRVNVILYIAMLVFATLFYPFSTFSKNAIDSLKTIIQKTPYDTTKIYLLLELADNYGWSNTAKMVELANEAKILSEKLNYKKGLFYSHQKLASAHYVTGEYNKGLNHAKTAYNLAKKEKNEKWLLDILNTLGLLHQQIKKYKESAIYFEQLIKLSKKNKNDTNLSGSYNNLANSYLFSGELEKSMHFRNLALSLRKKFNDTPGIADCYNDLGETYFLLNEIDSAIFYLQNCYRIKEKINDLEMISLSATNLGKAYLKKNKLAEAQKYLNIGLFNAEKIGSKSYKLAALEKLAFIANKQYNYQYEAELLNKIIKLKEEIINEESIKQINRLNTEFDTERKELQITSLLHEKEKQQTLAIEKEKRNKMIGIFFTIGTILLIIFLVILNGRFRIIKKQKIEIEKQKDAIETKQKEILDSILYAKRIQNGMLPNKNFLHKKLKELKQNNP